MYIITITCDCCVTIVRGLCVHLSGICIVILPRPWNHNKDCSVMQTENSEGVNTPNNCHEMTFQLCYLYLICIAGSAFCFLFINN